MFGSCVLVVYIWVGSVLGAIISWICLIFIFVCLFCTFVLVHVEAGCVSYTHVIRCFVLYLNIGCIRTWAQAWVGLLIGGGGMGRCPNIGHPPSLPPACLLKPPLRGCPLPHGGPPPVLQPPTSTKYFWTFFSFQVQDMAGVRMLSDHEEINEWVPTLGHCLSGLNLLSEGGHWQLCWANSQYVSS